MFLFNLQKHGKYRFLILSVCCIILIFLYIEYYIIEYNTIPIEIITNNEDIDAICDDIYEEYHIPIWKEMVKLRNEIGYDKLKCDNKDNSNKIIPFRIFQIGFHRAGTRSLFEFFTSNSYGSAHYQCKYNCSLDINNNKQICDHLPPCFRIMIQNYRTSKLLLDGLCHEYVYYGDFGISPQINTYLPYDIQFDILHDKYKDFWFEILDKQYSCSKFILNIRPLNNWLLSRSEHKAKYIKNSLINTNINQYWQLHSFFYFRPFEDRNKTNWNQDLSKDQVLEYWIRDWNFYNCYVINYFKSRNRMNDLLIFDVENDDIQQLIDFFGDDKDITLNLDAKHWKHTNWKHTNNDNTSSERESELDRLLKIC